MSCIDNINQHRRDWNPSLGSRSDLESGTAATCIVQEHVPPGAYEGPPYYQQPPNPPREDMSFERLSNDIKSQHLEGACVVVIFRSLLENLSDLKTRHSAAF
jgi:hypothetical protein